VLWLAKVQMQRHLISTARNHEVLVLGDSRFQNGIDDGSQSAENIVNLASSGESYIYAYWKLKFLLGNGTQFKKLVLSYGNHNLSENIDTMWVYNQSSLSEKFGSYWMYCDLDEWSYFNRKAVSTYTSFFNIHYSALNKSFYSIERQLLIRKLPYVGGYVKNEKRCCPDSSAKTTDTTKPTEFKYSSIQLDYLEKIISLCKQNNIEVYLVNTPVFKRSDPLVTPSLIVANNVRVLDYSNLLDDKKYFADFVHLNPLGAKVLTQQLLVDIGE
jgi:hypothetical protein